MYRGSISDDSTKKIRALTRKADLKRVANRVSANTDCVVIGEDPGSKADKAKQLGIKTLNAQSPHQILCS